ncbi:YqaJ viral recombinase family protein [Porticoccaceae bacterium]|nr:YqaJ viral recombinase family protein [Porticoccaceae bacterium]
MKKINLEQGSLEWFEYRFAHRNASEAPVIMGESPYQTRFQLFEEKRDKVISKGNAATQHGNNMEAAARAKAEEVLEVTLTPAIFEKGEYSASLDGYGELSFAGREPDTYKVEIKCPYSGEKGDTWKCMQSETNRIPEQYIWQLYHQCYVAPTTHTIFFVYIDDDTWDMCHFHPFTEKVEELLVAWDEFCANDPEPDWEPVTDGDVKAAIATHRMLKGQEKAIKANLATVEKLLKESVLVNSESDKTQLQWIERKGNVDYSKVPELEDVNLDDFRKESTRYMKITHPKESK